MDFPVEKLSLMAPEQERQFWEPFERDLEMIPARQRKRTWRPDAQTCWRGLNNATNSVLCGAWAWVCVPLKALQKNQTDYP